MPQFKSLYGHSGYGVVRRVRDRICSPFYRSYSRSFLLGTFASFPHSTRSLIAFNKTI